MREQGCIAWIVFLLLTVAGCATPQAVKSLSSEQLKVQKESRKACGEYFQLIEKAIGNTIHVFKQEEDQNLQDEIRIFQEQYRTASKQNGADTVTLLQELSEKIQKATENSNRTKSTYDRQYESLQKKHQEFLNMMDAMVDAQATLDAYIRLEKGDEAFANALFSTLGINRQILEKYEGELQQILPNALISQKGK